MDKTEELLKELTEAVGVSGFEDEIADLMVGHLSPLCEISRDRLGSVIAKKEGKKDCADNKPGRNAHVNDNSPCYNSQ